MGRLVMRKQGFTLTEIMITVVVIGILASIAIPGYRRTVIRNKRQGAIDVLMTIYAGQQVFKALRGQAQVPRSSGIGSPVDCFYVLPAFTGDNAEWLQIYMDNPNQFVGSTKTAVTGAVQFQVGLSAQPDCDAAVSPLIPGRVGSTFIARATLGNACSGSTCTLSIDQNKVLDESQWPL